MRENCRRIVIRILGDAISGSPMYRGKLLCVWLDERLERERVAGDQPKLATPARHPKQGIRDALAMIRTPPPGRSVLCAAGKRGHTHVRTLPAGGQSDVMGEAAW
ncbi:MAG TPA: hypothetical protein VFT22_32990 [Kofleriaceae bacterium]|nr:hypothetical protein [Kofleriaceae bacterium]